MSTPPEEFAPWLGVFETLRVVDGTPLFVPEHLAELRRAMQALGLTSDFDPTAARRELPRASGRWRWLVTPSGAQTFFTAEEPLLPEPIEIAVSPVCVGSANWDARFKTVSYLSHAQAAKTAKTPDVVLLNEHGEVASGARSNIFWRRGNRLFTPAHEVGCRCGVVRGFVLGRELVTSGRFFLSDLLAAEEVFLTNSLRGIVSVCRVEGKPVRSSETATRLRQAYEDEIARQIG